MWFVIADYFAVSDISVFRGASEFGEETCAGSFVRIHCQSVASKVVVDGDPS
jgi:hypothetical protein